MAAEPKPPLEVRPIPPDSRVFKYLRASQLMIDHIAQRGLQDDRVTTIEREFSWDKFEAITVSDNGDGTNTYTVVEGQHRTQAVKNRDESTFADTLVPCLITATKTRPEQSQLALDIVKSRKGHNGLEQWKLRLGAGHEHEMLAEVVLRERGLHLGLAPSPVTIGAVQTVKRICHGGNFTPEFGAELLDHTLDVLMRAWPAGDPESNTSRWERSLLLAVAETILRNDGVYDPERLSRSLRIRPAPQWVSLGRGRQEESPFVVIGVRLVDLYNKGLRVRRIKW